MNDYPQDADDRQQADIATEYEAWLSDAKAQAEYREWLNSQPSHKDSDHGTLQSGIRRR